MNIKDLTWNIIGTIHSPRQINSSSSSVSKDDDKFYISVKNQYLPGIRELEQFHYIYVLFLFHKSDNPPYGLLPDLPFLNTDVGVFATRSPFRPNPLGLSVAKITKIIGNKIIINYIDVFDGTPVLDIKPYMKSLDVKSDSNNGWMTPEVIQKIKDYEK